MALPNEKRSEKAAAPIISVEFSLIRQSLLDLQNIN